MKYGKNLKRNLVIMAALLFVGAAAYLNWSYNAQWDGTDNAALVAAEDAAMAAADAEYEAAMLNRQEEPAQETAVSDYFAEARLTRQQSRDEALGLLETAAASEAASQETIDSAMNAISAMATQSMLESQIENELLAKDFADCVVYITEDNVTVAVPAPVDGLSEAAVARVTETVTSSTSYEPTQINIIEVRS